MSLTVSCSICMANYDEKDDDDFVSVKCGHAFHRSCLLEWKKSSHKMECPECRQKYTAKALKKLFLHTLPKDDDEHFLELQKEKEKYEKLMKEVEVVRSGKRTLEHTLLQTHNEYENLRQKQIKLSQDFEMKCNEYDAVTMVNNEYLKINNKLKRENLQLLSQTERLVMENADLKLQQVKVTKPFVDLTVDDDSDVEIIETEKKPEVAKIPEISEILDTPKTPEIIQIEETNESDTNEMVDPTTSDIFAKYDLKNQDFEDLEKFILEQI